MEDALPMPSAWKLGGRTFRQTMRSRWLAWTAFVLSGRGGSVALRGWWCAPVGHAELLPPRPFCLPDGLGCCAVSLARTHVRGACLPSRPCAFATHSLPSRKATWTPRPPAARMARASLAIRFFFAYTVGRNSRMESRVRLCNWATNNFEFMLGFPTMHFAFTVGSPLVSRLASAPIGIRSTGHE